MTKESDSKPVNGFLALSGALLDASLAAQDAKRERMAETIDKLIEIYDNSRTATRVLDYLNFASDHFKVNSVQHLSEETKEDYYSVVELLKLFYTMEIERFIVGRKGKDSRIEWAYDPKSIGEAANLKSDILRDISDELEEYDGGEENPVEMKEHEFYLRPDLKIKLNLPADFNGIDVAKLKAYVDFIVL